MIIFYCVLLVAILFLLFMEIVTWPASVGQLLDKSTNAHVIHILAYVICFICICFLLARHLYFI